MELNQFIPVGSVKSAGTAELVSWGSGITSGSQIASIACSNDQKIVIFDSSISTDVTITAGSRTVHSSAPLLIEATTDTRAYPLIGGWGETITITANETTVSNNLNYIVLEKDR